MGEAGAIVVDVGINRVDIQRERGWRLAGDVHPDVESVASLLSRTWWRWTDDGRNADGQYGDGTNT